MTGWLAKERAAASERARCDEIAKERLAVAWQRIYDERERLAEDFRALANVVGDYLSDHADRDALGQALVAAANALGRYDYPCPHSRVNEAGTCEMCGQEGIELVQSAAQIDGEA